eukprot:s5598_g5.t1
MARAEDQVASDALAGAIQQWTKLFQQPSFNWEHGSVLTFRDARGQPRGAVDFVNIGDAPPRSALQQVGVAGFTVSTAGAICYACARKRQAKRGGLLTSRSEDGSTGSEMTWTAERLDVEASCWTIEKVLPQVPVRVGATLVWSIQGLVSIGGVLGGQSCPTACTECLTLQRHGATLWIPRLAPAVITSCEGNIFVMGGSHKKEASNFTEMWVQEQQCWRELPPMLAAREGAFAAVLR